MDPRYLVTLEYPKIIEQLASHTSFSASKELALRLQADMINFRRRQEQRANQAIEAEKLRLLAAFLGILDNLEAALTHIPQDDPLYGGVSATYDSMVNLLLREGVQAIPAVEQPFDPNVHEAVATVPAVPDQPTNLWVVEEERRGYRLGDAILRPACVIVAKQ